MKFLKKNSFLLVSIGLLGALSPLWIEWPMVGLMKWLLPSEGSTPVDEIVILGRGAGQRPARIEDTFALWQANKSSRVFVSGMSDATEIMDVLAEGGIPKTSLRGERCSQSTDENGQFTATLLSETGSRNILLITDRSHLLRATLIFKSYGFAVTPYPAETVEGDSFSYQKVLINLREYAGLVGYFLAGKFEPKSSAELQIAQAQAQAILNDWNCEVTAEELSQQ